MANSDKNIIQEIAENLDCGNDCYYNPKTDEIISIPNFSNLSDEEAFKEAFGQDLEKLKEQKAGFIKFEILESFESFKIMEQFAEQLTDEKFKLELESILLKKKPFRHFKHSIDNSHFRQNWFDFKQNKLEKIVATQLERKKPAHNNTHSK